MSITHQKKHQNPTTLHQINWAGFERYTCINPRTIALLLACCALLVSPTNSVAQASLQIENDAFGPSWGDDDYTNGIRISLGNRYLLGWSPFSRYKEIDKIPYYWRTKTMTFMIGQNLYTPQNIESTRFQTDDRPYAAWLYAVAAAHLVETKRKRTLELHFGTTGKPALGRIVQTWWHSVVNAPRPNGWEHQVKPVGLGVIGIWQDMFAFYCRQTDSISNLLQYPLVVFVPHYRIAVGNVHTAAEVGAILLIGYNLGYKYGYAYPIVFDTIMPLKIGPTISTTLATTGESTRSNWSCYGFVSIEGRAVAYNALLQHDTYTRTRRKLNPIERKVATLEAGIGARYKRFHVRYQLLLRSPEFHSGRWSRYAGIYINYSHKVKKRTSPNQPVSK